MLSKSLRHEYVGLWGVTITALTLVGCGGSAGGPPPGSIDAYMTLQWKIFGLEDTAKRQASSCEDVGAANFVLYSTNVTTGVTYTDTFLCFDYQGTSAGLPSGPYNLQPNLFGDPAIYGNSTTVLYRTSFDQVLGAGANTLGVTDLVVNAFVLEWTISLGGAPTACGAVGATTVELDVDFPAPLAPITYKFPCADYQSTTTAIQLGSYPVTWQASILGANNTNLAAKTPQQTFEVIATSKADLGTVNFAM